MPMAGAESSSIMDTAANDVSNDEEEEEEEGAAGGEGPEPLSLCGRARARA